MSEREGTKLARAIMSTPSLSNQPEGSLAMDRYKSLQKRNMIEPRQFVK